MSLMTANLAPHELELFERLVAAYEQDREELFVVVYTSSGTVIKHKGLRELGWRNDGAALAGLDAARLLLVQSSDSTRPKSFYLASNAPDELAAMMRAAAEAAYAVAEQAAAEQAAAGHQPLSLAEALERMIAFQKDRPGGFFTPYDTYSNPSIGYSGRLGEHLYLTHGEFARLMTCGALDKREERLGVYYLSPQAGDILAAEQRLQSDGPLARAEQRIAAMVRRRASTAKWLGRLAGAGVLLGTLYLVLNREQLFPPGELAGTLYEVATVVAGVTGIAVAAGVVRVVRRGVESLLRWWLDPAAEQAPTE